MTPKTVLQYTEEKLKNIELEGMFLSLKQLIYRNFYLPFRFLWIHYFSRHIRKQINEPKTIPVLIINFNQLYYLRQLLTFLSGIGFKNIIIIDNNSTYPPLLEFYDKLGKEITVERMEQNYGHMVFFENKLLQEKYGNGYYILTDADIVPNPNLPEDFASTMLKLLRRYFFSVNKVGFALNVSDIPDYYPLKETVLEWEEKFWKNRVNFSTESYFAKIDTTFALYKPGYPRYFNTADFLKGIRIGNHFTAVHGGWYVDPHNMTAEQQYYQQSSSSASSWLLRKDEDLQGRFTTRYNKPKELRS